MAVKILYDVIKEKRNTLDISQQDLSEISGVNVNTIKALETARMNTTKSNITKIAEVLGLNVQDIYFDDFRDTKVIAVANNKGGCGKTSVSSGLGYALSENKENKILLIDSDMQMNLSHSYGIKRSKDINLNIALKKEDSLINYINKTTFPNIDIIISDLQMATIEMELFQMTFRETVFARILKPVIDSGIYDYIIIDTNPTLGMLNLNVLNASDFVIIPVEMTAFGLMGLEVIIDYIRKIQQINKNLKIGGILRTRVDIREGVTHEVGDILTNNDKIKVNVFETLISIDTNIKKSQWETNPAYPFNIKSRVAEQYRDLSKEVIKLVK